MWFCVESYDKLQVDFIQLAQKRNDLLEQKKLRELQQNEAITTKNISYERREYELENEIANLTHKFTTETNNMKVNYQSQLNEVDNKLKQLMVANVHLKYEHAELQTLVESVQRNTNHSSDQDGYAKEIDYYRNLLIHRDAQIDELERELMQADAAEAQFNSTNILGNSVLENVLNVSATYVAPIINQSQPTSNTFNAFHYVANSLPINPPREKRLNEEWSAEDYDKYAGMYLHKINPRKTALETNLSEDSNSGTSVTASTFVSESPSVRKRVASISFTKLSVKKPKQNGDETISNVKFATRDTQRKKRKLLSESMQNADDSD